jgi:hypothetical protein
VKSEGTTTYVPVGGFERRRPDDEHAGNQREADRNHNIRVDGATDRPARGDSTTSTVPGTRAHRRGTDRLEERRPPPNVPHVSRIAKTRIEHSGRRPPRSQPRPRLAPPVAGAAPCAGGPDPERARRWRTPAAGRRLQVCSVAKSANPAARPTNRRRRGRKAARAASMITDDPEVGEVDRRVGHNSNNVPATGAATPLCVHSRTSACMRCQRN